MGGESRYVEIENMKLEKIPIDKKMQAFGKINKSIDVHQRDKEDK